MFERWKTVSLFLSILLVAFTMLLLSFRHFDKEQPFEETLTLRHQTIPIRLPNNTQPSYVIEGKYVHLPHPDSQPVLPIDTLTIPEDLHLDMTLTFDKPAINLDHLPYLVEILCKDDSIDLFFSARSGLNPLYSWPRDDFLIMIGHHWNCHGNDQVNFRLVNSMQINLWFSKVTFHTTTVDMTTHLENYSIDFQFMAHSQEENGSLQKRDAFGVDKELEMSILYDPVRDRMINIASLNFLDIPQGYIVCKNCYMKTKSRIKVNVSGDRNGPRVTGRVQTDYKIVLDFFISFWSEITNQITRRVGVLNIQPREGSDKITQDANGIAIELLERNIGTFEWPGNLGLAGILTLGPTLQLNVRGVINVKPGRIDLNSGYHLEGTTGYDFIVGIPTNGEKLIEVTPLRDIPPPKSNLIKPTGSIRSGMDIRLVPYAGAFMTLSALQGTVKEQIGIEFQYVIGYEASKEYAAIGRSYQCPSPDDLQFKAFHWLTMRTRIWNNVAPLAYLMSNVIACPLCQMCVALSTGRILWNYDHNKEPDGSLSIPPSRIVAPISNLGGSNGNIKDVFSMENIAGSESRVLVAPV